MRCVVLHGSPNVPYTWGTERVTSYTDKLVDEVTGELSRLGDWRTEHISLLDANIPYCIGCTNCFYKGEGKCPHAQKVQPIMEALRAADLLILTSPVYALNVSALVKGFFDHAAYNYHRPSFFGKRALVVSSTAGGGARFACKYMRQTLTHWGYGPVRALAVAKMGALKPSDRRKAQCRKLARRLQADAIQNRVSRPSLKRALFFQLWRNMARAGAPGTADREYWAESGLQDCTWPPGRPISPPVRAFGALMNRMFKAFMKEKG